MIQEYFTKDKFQKLYEDELDAYLEQCDWVTHVKSETICMLIKVALNDHNYVVDSEDLHKKYMAKVESLGLTDKQWREKYGISEIISLIYDILSETS